jgi:hypothetical protein
MTCIAHEQHQPETEEVNAYEEFKQRHPSMAEAGGPHRVANSGLCAALRAVFLVAPPSSLSERIV